MTAYVHTDRGSSFIITDLKKLLYSRGIAMSCTTPCNAQGDSQCWRYNGTIWKTRSLALMYHKLPINCWEAIIPNDLHSVRTSINSVRTSINVSTDSTPYKRLF